MPNIEWHNPSRAKERLLFFGGYGCGKTKAYLQILQKVAGHKYIIECDNTLDEFLESEEFEDLGVQEEWVNGKEVDDYTDENGKLSLYRIHNGDDDWSMFSKTVKGLKPEGNDWVVIDGANLPWEWVKDWYLERAYGRDIGMHLLMARQQLIKEGKEGHGVTEKLIREWEPINGEYQKFSRWLVNAPCNVIVVTPEKKLSDQQTDKMLNQEFGGVGYVPEGQKHLAGQVRTVVRFTKSVRQREKDKFSAKVIKDRQRDGFDMEWTDGNFFDEYLKKVGGWKPKVAGS